MNTNHHHGALTKEKLKGDSLSKTLRAPLRRTTGWPLNETRTYVAGSHGTPLGTYSYNRSARRAKARGATSVTHAYPVTEAMLAKGTVPE